MRLRFIQLARLCVLALLTAAPVTLVIGQEDVPIETVKSEAAPADPSFAAALGARNELRELTRQLELQLDQLLQDATDEGQRIDAYTEELAMVAPGSQAADDLDSRLTDDLIATRRVLRHALDSWRSPSGVESPDTEELRALNGAITTTPSEEWSRIVDEIGQTVSEGRSAEEALRWARVDVHRNALERLTPLRIRSMELTSPARSKQIFGVTREGFEQLTREVEHLALKLRVYLVVRKHDLSNLPSALQDPFIIGAVVFTLLRLVLVLLVFATIGGRWREWLESIRPRLMRSSRSLAWKRRTERLLAIIEVALPWTLVLVGIEAVRWALDETALEILYEIDLALSLLTYYAAYRLAIDLVVAAIERTVSRYDVTVTTPRHELLVGSVRAFFRVAFTLLIIIVLSGLVFGGGYLNHLAVRFASIALVLTLFVLLIRWRKVLADSFLERNATGKVAELVASTRDHWYGVFVAPASFLWIAGRAATAVTGDFAMGFEQTRRTLAFLFRRKIEKQAEKQGYAEGDLEILPAGVIEAFTEEPVLHGPLVIEHFPDLDALHSDLSLWRTSGAGGSCLLTGSSGIGKTTWLNQIRREDMELVRVELGGRVVDEESLGRILTLRIAPEEDLDGSLDALARHLNTGERKMILLDLGHHLFLTSVGGYRAWSAFTELVDRTRNQIFWLCSMSRHSWQHLRSVRTDWAVFRRRIHLGPWTEERIRQLISARMAASECRYDFASLVLDRLEGVSKRAQLIESAEGYTRMLWDYADGNPRVALHFFTRSLDPQSGGRVQVRLFMAPDVTQLEDVGEPGLFILSAIVTHESISFENMATVTRFPENLCRIHLDRFTDLGVLREDEGLYRITTHWQRATIRTLRRRNILAL